MKKFFILVISIFLLALSGCELEKNENKYLVTFNTNGGTNVKQQLVLEGSTATIPVEPTKSGYLFAGWFLDGELYDFNKPVNDNLLLIAKWYEMINVCDNTCKNGYSLDKDCNCIKTNNTDTNITKETKTKTLSVSEKEVTLLVDDETYIEAFTSDNVTWKSNNISVVDVNNGFIKGIKPGKAIVTASTKNSSAKITIYVITKDEEKLEVFKSIITSKEITNVNTSLLYSYSDCTITNTANIINSKGIEITNGIVTKLDKNINDTIISAYTLKCGERSDNISVEHTVKS